MKHKMMTLLASGTALALLPLTGNPAYAQDANTSIRLDPVVVQTGSGKPSDGTAPVDGFVPAATTTGSKSSVAIEKSRNLFPSLVETRWMPSVRRNLMKRCAIPRRARPAFRRR